MGGEVPLPVVFFSINLFNWIVFKGQGVKLSSRTVFPPYPCPAQTRGQHLFSTTLTHWLLSDGYNGGEKLLWVTLTSAWMPQDTFFRKQLKCNSGTVTRGSQTKQQPDPRGHLEIMRKVAAWNRTLTLTLWAKTPNGCFGVWLVKLATLKILRSLYIWFFILLHACQN